jgi:hypothetical protein
MIEQRPQASIAYSRQRAIDFLQELCKATTGKTGMFDRFGITLDSRAELELTTNRVLEDVSQTLKDGSELYLIENTLVPVQDRNRIIGPLTMEGVEQKRRAYEQFASNDPSIKKNYPFIVYKFGARLEKVEPTQAGVRR